MIPILKVNKLLAAPCVKLFVISEINGKEDNAPLTSLSIPLKIISSILID